MVTSARSQETPTILDATFEATSFDVLEVTVPGARIHLRPHTGGQRVEIHGFVPDRDPSQARTLFGRKGISTHQSGDRLYVFGEGPSSDTDGWRWRRGEQGEVHLDLRVPETLNVEVHSPGGAVHAAGLRGTTELNVVGGSVELEDMQGTIRVTGSGKRLGVHDVNATSVDLDWTTGSVVLENASTESLSLHAVSAPVTADDIHGPTDLTVHGGPLRLRNLDGPCQAKVYGGTLAYSGTPAHATFLRAVGGSVQTQFPITLDATVHLAGQAASIDDAFPFSGEKTSKEVEGTLNEGGPHIELHAIRGDALCHVLGNRDS